jgi:uncharacterized protein (DUF1501 family)
MSPLFRTDCEGFHRRDFLKIGAGGLLGLSLSQLLRLEARAATKRASDSKRRANAVIQLWLAGGPATIDMWDLKPNAPDGIRGTFKPIVTKVDGIRISEHLPRMAQSVSRATIVRSLYHTIPAHGPATVFMTTGNKPTPALEYPSLGSLVARLLPAEASVPPYMSFSALRNGSAGQAGYLGPAYNPFSVEGGGVGKNGPAPMTVRGISLPSGFTLNNLENRNKLLEAFDHGFRGLDHSTQLVEGMDQFHHQALDILRSSKTKEAFNLGLEPLPVRERYGVSTFGQGVLAARRLVEAGVRFVTVSLGGWDTHARNFETLSKRLLPQLDQTLSALIEDLNDRGMLEQTVVYCAGEFGRTPKINPGAGRDHWARSMAVVLAGGGFKRGYIHGATDGQGMAPATEPCTPDDVSATLFHCLGIDPRMELKTSTGRPITLFREGQVVEKLLA